MTNIILNSSSSVYRAASGLASRSRISRAQRGPRRSLICFATIDAKLQHIFEKIEKAEQSHYDTVTGMLAGTLPAQQGQQSKGQASRQKAEKDLKSTASRAEKQRDAYLLSDLLGTEKYVSGVYNTAVFEFSDAKARQVLAAIQQQEQEHGKQLSDYMQANNMYC